jgi:hypothetical protein
VLDPFEGDTVVTGLLASTDGYVAIVASGSDEGRFRLWTSADGILWTARADQDTAFSLLDGTGGDLIADLTGDPVVDPDPRPIAFTFDGRWLEVTEAVGGERFVPVAVATDGDTRLVSGFVTGDDPLPLVLVATD